MQPLFGAAMITLALALMIEARVAVAADIVWPVETVPRQINITSDSAPGWRPSADQDAAIQMTTPPSLAARDEGRFADAYSLLTNENRRNQPFMAFATNVANFNRLAGPVVERRIVIVTWTKDPARAPAPGVYAAFDDNARCGNIDRYCGYLVLYQPPSGGAFQVMREEFNFIDSKTASEIERQRSRAGLDAVWNQMSAHCPE